MTVFVKIGRGAEGFVACGTVGDLLSGPPGRALTAGVHIYILRSMKIQK
jgi:hypothetical protein